MIRVHGTAVVVAGRGVLLRGPPGAGKSDLALRLIAGGGTLVADDQVEIEPVEGALIASPPETIAGLLEVRGVGIRRLPFVRSVRLVLVVDLVAAIERLPEARHAEIAGLDLPALELLPFEASAVAKLRLALDGEADVGRGKLYMPPAMREPSRSPSDRDAAGGTARTRILLITGMSGAGRSAALKFLEDMGYEAVDNLPLSLLPRLAAAGPPHPIAVGIDVRTRDFAVESVFGEFETLTVEHGLEVRLVFVDCDDEVLARRYTETRRRHPLAGDRPVIDGIRLERLRVAPLRDRADLMIDTSQLRTAELKRLLAGHFALDDRPGLSLAVTSFSYREGLPREADLVFDVRFLANPFYEPALRDLTGRDREVADFVAADPGWPAFFEGLTGLLRTLLPSYEREGKSYLTVALGCTGGHHRSVYAAERLGEWLAGSGYAVAVSHRDIGGPANPNIGDPRAAVPSGASGH
ncbi:MAG TPA: RNase adapter RapZ [Stellaceae bacterium]|nr:RNase adapter RapZ [Stellaceae bacterium]